MFLGAVVTVLHLAVVLFIIIAGLCKASASNMQPFLLDSGARGIFDGAALVQLSCSLTNLWKPSLEIIASTLRVAETILTMLADFTDVADVVRLLPEHEGHLIDQLNPSVGH